MPNRILSSAELATLFEPIFAQTVAELVRLAGGDDQLLWALRRKLTKELGYLERGCPQKRSALKQKKYHQQKRKCAVCGRYMRRKGSELDRRQAIDGYTLENTRLVHHHCHFKDQERKRFR